MGIHNKFIQLVKDISMAVKTEKITKVLVPIDRDKILEGKNAIIVGGTGGIGTAIATRLAASGCNVIITGRTEVKAQHIADEIGYGVKGTSFDITNITQIETRINDIAKKFDNGSIDILVNAAGIICTKKFLDISEKDWDSVMDANIKGIYFTSQAVAKHMISKQIKGHILNISSASSLRHASGPYQISKWALNGFTKGLADELLPYGIVCNGIAPGPVATPMMGKKEGDTLFNVTNPAGRCASAEEIANLALFLVSSMGELMIGETYLISGGGGNLSYHN